MSVMNDMCGKVDGLKAQIAELQQQRNILMTAMMQVEHATAPTHDDGAYHENAYSIAVAAIAKVKGNV